MDLGIAGRRALLSASSDGLGLACARALAAEGVSVVLNGRDMDRLSAARSALAASYPAVTVSAVAGDVRDAGTRERLVAEAGDVDILVTNAGGPPPLEFDDWSREQLQAAFDANAFPALDLIESVAPGMRERRFGRIVNITSAMVKAPAPDMGLSAAARTALTAAAKAMSRALAPHNVTVNNLLPEKFDTARVEFMTQRKMRLEGIGRDEARRRTADSVAARRLGNPEEFGAACAFLCSNQAGYISGQSLLLDGGTYEGLL